MKQLVPVVANSEKANRCEFLRDPKHYGSRAKRFSHHVGNLLLGPPAVMKLLFRSLRLWWDFRLLRRQDFAIRLCREAPNSLTRPRVLAVVTHVVSEQHAKGGPGVDIKLERLVRTLDSLLISFGHCELGMIINTCPGRHLIALLPDYLRARIEVVEQTEVDPTYSEFLVPDIFLDHRGEFDWFVFAEDDTLVNDSCLLEKLTLFNSATKDPSMLLTPHRFEMLEGKKYHIDLLWPEFKECKECSWNRLATFAIAKIKFGECNRPHSAWFCLNREQLDLWGRSGRRWKNHVVYIGPLESAATYCLFEVFTLFKPHRDNLHFFEVQHWDTKYSRLVKANSQAAQRVHVSEVDASGCQRTV